MKGRWAVADFAEVDMRIDGAARLRDAAKDLREAGRGDLRKQLLREIRAAGKPAVDDVKRAVKATPSKGQDARRGRRSLRAAIAKATRLQILTTWSNPSIRIKVAANKFKEASNPATLPKYYDDTLGKFTRWRHPVFGHTEWKDGRSAWVTQEGHPYFFTTIRRHEDDFRAGVSEAIDHVLDELSH